MSDDQDNAVAAAPSLSFPTDPDTFARDDRISFSKLDGKYIAVQDDGTELEFDAQLRRWIPTVDEEEFAAHQRTYGGGGDGDDAADGNDNSSSGGQKRKRQKEEAAQARKKHQQKQPPQPKQNTAIYVTGLPPDATVDEVHEVFSRKCGVVAEEIDSGRPRIKLYSDADGRFKGDALVVFFKPQSVDMAIMLLDDTEFRYGTSGRMRVQAADASYKKTHHDAEGGSGAAAAGNNGNAGASASSSNNHEGGGGGGGGSNTHQRPRNNREREQEKQKIIKRTQKLDAKLADWDDDEPSYATQLLQQQQGNGRDEQQQKTVILRHMFTLEELEEDPAALLDIKEDVRDECAKLGPVTNVVLYDGEPDGIVAVRFRDPAAAAACLDRMDGRAFDGRTVRAAFATGRERFRKSGKGDADDEQ